MANYQVSYNAATKLATIQAKGAATITATTVDGGFTATAAITVS